MQKGEGRRRPGNLGLQTNERQRSTSDIQWKSRGGRRNQLKDVAVAGTQLPEGNNGVAQSGGVLFDSRKGLIPDERSLGALRQPRDDKRAAFTSFRRGKQGGGCRSVA